MFEEILLFTITTVTSCIAAIFGLGGGMMLIAILPSFLPPAALLPVHGVTQLVSNVSRAAMDWKNVEWRFLPKFILGSLLGMAIAGYLVTATPPKYIPALIGGYILLNLWSKWFSGWISRFENLYLAGLTQTGLALAVGAPGPIGLYVMLKMLADRDRVIVTAAVMMAISHLFKIVFFGFVGFIYVDYLYELLALVAGATFGSFCGTRLRKKISNDRFLFLIKLLMSGLAINLMASAVNWK